MIRLYLTFVIVICTYHSFGQIEVKAGITYSKIRVVKSTGLTVELGYRNNHLQYTLSNFRHTPAPNQTVNSLTIEPKGVYQFGIAYLRSIQLNEFSLGLGAGYSAVRGPRYFIVDTYDQGGYNIYRVEDGPVNTMTINWNLSYKYVYLFSRYDTKVKNIRLGLGFRLSSSMFKKNSA